MQKSEYEQRSSVWSSYGCSSYLTDILADSKQLIEIDITGSLGAGQQHQRKSLFLRLGERPNFVIDHKRLMDEMRSNLIQNAQFLRLNFCKRLDVFMSPRSESTRLNSSH